MKHDISTIEDIQKLVDQFYDKVKRNPHIGPIFIGTIRDNWPAHLEKMYRFWETVLLNQYSYKGSPFAPHADMSLQGQHFDTWLTLFHQTVDENFNGSKADEAKWRAEKMATMFLSKIEFLHNNPHQKNL